MIPLFVITRDRLEVLKRSLQSYWDCIKTPYEIVIHDNDSTYPPTVEYLKGLEKSGIKVYWNTTSELGSVRDSIRDFMARVDGRHYVVTDPDVELDNVPGDILEVYASLIEYFTEYRVIGLSLRWDDIPDHYPFKERAVTGDRIVWSQEIKYFNYQGNVFPYVVHHVDTTFAMYRNEPRHGPRLLMSEMADLITMPPYTGRHLDWYQDPNNLTADQRYYAKTCGTVNHWNIVQNT